MSRRARVRLISLLCAALLCTAGLAAREHAQAQRFRRQLSNGYQHAFAELTTQLGGMDAALRKSRYAASPALLSALCAEVYSRACSAQLVLGELPWSNVKLEQTAAFLAKTGDYAWFLAKACLTDGAEEDSRQTLSALAQVSSQLSRSVDALQEELNRQDFSPEAMLRAEEALSALDGEEPLPAGRLFQSMEEELPALPTLLYDGPFSEHLTNRVPKLLEGREEVDEAAARRAAAAFLDLPEQALTLLSTGEGSLPTYGFSVEREEGSLYIEVTRQGGAVLELFSDRPAGPEQLSAQSARTIAEELLRERGYGDMAETYSLREGGCLVINYAFQQDGVICYPDLVQVSVALDTGELAAFRAGGYVNSHTARALPAPALSEERARAALSPALTALSHRLAVIPTAGEGEVFCHEFLCQDEDGGKVLVYLNAQTGREERLLLLLETENGSLVR